MHSDGQRRVIGASQNAIDLGITNEQQALLIPDMVLEKQWKDGGLKWSLVASNGLWKVRNGRYCIGRDQIRTYKLESEVGRYSLGGRKESWKAKWKTLKLYPAVRRHRSNIRQFKEMQPGATRKSQVGYLNILLSYCFSITFFFFF